MTSADSLQSTPAVDVGRLAGLVGSGFARTVAELKQLVAIPGIAWDAFEPAELRRSAEAVAELVRSTGLEDVRILSVDTPEGRPGGPAVVARRPARDGKPTILLYAHHDVQPPGDEELWNTPPFVATERNGRLYGRGAADDKAGIMVHIAALRAVLEAVADFGLGVTFFFEGEEEAGSPSFRGFLETHRELLAADVIVVADSCNWKVGVPSLTTSLRGMVAGEFEVRVLEHAVHSGMFGGPVLDAPTLAARIIASFHDAEGNLAIEGLAAQEVEQVDYAEEDFRRDAAVLEGVRLAPGQDPVEAGRALERHVLAQDVLGARVDFRLVEAGNGYAADLDSPAAQASLWALEQAWGVPAVDMGIGGSIPFIADLNEIYPEAQILVTGVEDPDSRAHSANESLHLEEFRRAVLAEALLLARLDTPRA